VTELFVKRDLSAIDRYWGSPYLQHNLGIPDGHENLAGFVKSLGPDFKYETGMVVAEGDFVMIHGRYTGFGPKPLLAVDIFQVKNGKLMEHWYVVQEEVPASATKSGRSMFTADK
jgi:predicted SnoaL-like aldol condensation-catalyzing enzyme